MPGAKSAKEAPQPPKAYIQGRAIGPIFRKKMKHIKLNASRVNNESPGEGSVGGVRAPGSLVPLHLPLSPPCHHPVFCCPLPSDIARASLPSACPASPLKAAPTGRVWVHVPVLPLPSQYPFSLRKKVYTASNFIIQTSCYLSGPREPQTCLCSCLSVSAWAAALTKHCSLGT